MAAFLSQLDLAIELNRHFVKNEYGDLCEWVGEWAREKDENETDKLTSNIPIWLTIYW